MAAIKIKKSVGKNGKNGVADVKAVQTLLNRHKSAGGFGALKVDGAVGKKTLAAIKAFQSKVMGGKADSRVDPGKATITALNAKPGAVAPPAPSGGKTGGGGKDPKGSGGRGRGGSDEEQLAELEKRFAAAELTVGKTSGEIIEREDFAARLDIAEARIVAANTSVDIQVRAAVAAFDDLDERLKAKHIEEVRNTSDDLERCLAKVEKEARPLDGVTCDKALAANFKALNKVLSDDRITRFVERLTEAEKKLKRAFKYALAGVKLMRAGNAAYALALKAKRAVFEKSMKDAARDIKKLRKKLKTA